MQLMCCAIRWLLILCFPILIPLHASAAAPRGSVATHERSVTKVADGIYAIRHKDAPDTNPQGNTVVIIGARDVLVVDSGYLPSSTQEDIEQIRNWTDKPVRYLVNTHWHPDHIRGNTTYREAFPDVAIIAHAKTPELERGFDEQNLVRYRARVASLRRQIESDRAEDGKPLTETERKEAVADLARRTPVLREFEGYVASYPTVLLTDEMTIDLGGRIAIVRHLGSGHTVGDVIVQLPAEKILIAGDLVAHPVPYFFAGWPYDLIHVLEAIRAMDLRTIVPGHGPVLHDKAYLREMLDLLNDARGRVVQEVRRRGSLSAKLEDVRKAVDFRASEKRFAGDDPENLEFFRQSMDGLVRGLYDQIEK